MTQRPITTPAASTARARLTGLAATLGVLAILGGLPAVLLAVGGAPNRLPSLDGLVGALTRPDDGTLAVTAFVILGWLAWAVLTGSILAEAAAMVRGRAVRPLPGLAVPQGAARVLVTTAALLFVSTPLATPAVAAATGTTPPTPAATAATGYPSSGAGATTATSTSGIVHPSDRSPAVGADSRPRPGTEVGDTPDAPMTGTADSVAPRRHAVRQGDSLWSIAEEHLGSGRRYPEIAALNRDILGARPDFLTPGTALRLPAPTTRSTRGTTRPDGDATGRPHVVQRGDTLSEIAATELGNPNRYPEIFDASRDTPQPGGARLTDPDVIDIGWTLTIPDTPTATDTGRASSQPDPRPDSRTADDRSTDRHDTGAGGDVSGASASGSATQEPATEGPSDNTTPNSANPAGASAATATPPGRAAASATTPPAGPPGSATTATSGADTHQTAADTSTDTGDSTGDGTVTPAWLLTGLTGAGGILAGSMFLALRARRRAQFRARRPGRTITVPRPELAPVEKTVTVTGEPAAARVEWLDEVLRRLAAAQTATAEPMPQLAAIQLGPTDLTLHLSQTQDATAPWRSAGDRRRWHLPTSTGPDDVGPPVPDQPAPYPLLVTVGTTDTGETWLLNCELLTPLTITGDPTYAQDLARYLAAELACNPWSHGVTVHCIGVAEELAALNPERVRAQPTADTVAGEALTDATSTLHSASDAGLDVPTARSAQAGADHWHATLLLLDESTAQDVAVQQLRALITDNPGMTSTSVVLTGRAEATDGVAVHVTAEGRITIPAVGLDLVAVGLTPDEAKGCAALLAQADNTADDRIPADPQALGWRALADEAGALREEHTLTRDALTTLTTAEDRPTSILDLRDEDYLEAAATTIEDLETLAPAVTPETRHLVEDTDPHLDRDLQAWFSEHCDLPRLTLLGPVRARTRGVALTKRKPYYTELLAYLATRPYGATPDELADAFSLTPARARNDVKIVRDWLGINPRTGRKHLPDAREAPAAKARGVGVYQVEDVLTDLDLFKRLRLRGEARGADGIADLRRALTLVEGRPFDRLRPGGWSWLLEGDRLDHHMLCAVVDVAHLVTTHSLQAGDHRTARAAAELACLAAPYEEIPRLDLAAVAAAEGHHREAERIATDEICGRAEQPGPPDELPDRTERILEQHAWLRSSQAAS
ncbi:LysM peptidoglycan-binding domain-containing protein [Intrasporangium calvum]|uniref:LysM peptidoglycan-binding domain-containing protein n=1 Tax=Intrasporangium calvum TaxID=53358 RepID=A0ABT5GIN8_9MICO|nr:LysM peptidoglycan-binding domain-containing protein [Intrasporangium calvum]MDC5698074.1 LysM peptidoglycan-binding domain-containing protein [Intrasporangium calvum]